MDCRALYSNAKENAKTTELVNPETNMHFVGPKLCFGGLTCKTKWLQMVESVFLSGEQLSDEPKSGNL